MFSNNRYAALAARAQPSPAMRRPVPAARFPTSRPSPTTAAAGWTFVPYRSAAQRLMALPRAPRAAASLPESVVIRLRALVSARAETEAPPRRRPTGSARRRARNAKKHADRQNAGRLEPGAAARGANDKGGAATPRHAAAPVGSGEPAEGMSLATLSRAPALRAEARPAAEKTATRAAADELPAAAPEMSLATLSRAPVLRAEARPAAAEKTANAGCT